jgi:hypothetical protein
MLSHGIVNASHVAGLLSSIDGVTDAIDVQVAKSKGDLEQKLSSFLSSTKSMCNNYMILTVLP